MICSIYVRGPVTVFLIIVPEALMSNIQKCFAAILGEKNSLKRYDVMISRKKR